MIKHLALLLFLVASLSTGAPVAQAKDAKVKDSAAAEHKATVQMSNKEDGPPMTAFGAGAPSIYATNYGEKMKKGDKVKFVWTIEDGGKTINPNSKVSEYTAVANGYENGKEYSHLEKPATGWPLGKWRVDVYVNEAKAASVKFTIK